MTDVEEVRITQEAIPVKDIRDFEALLTILLQPGVLPAEWGRANFQVPYPIRAVTEVRGGAITFIGHAVERTAVGANDVSSSDPIQGAWTIGGIEVLPRTPKIVDRPTRATIRLRLHGKERLELGRRPEDFTGSSKDFGAFFNRDAFYSLLAKVLRVPFKSLDDFVVDGYDTEYPRAPGVRVFHGQIRSRERSAQRRADKSAAPAHWWDEMRLFVTDSDPQYFCVSIVLGRDDVTSSPQP